MLAGPLDAHGGRATRWAVPALLAALSLFRLWLGAGLALWIPAGSGRDDAHFLAQAGEILGGRWLGRYDCLTLAKAPLYPAFLAGTLAAGVPLILAQQALYVLACAVFAAALAPALHGRFAPALLHMALLFQPAGFAAATSTRVVREGIYPALTLLVLAFAGGTVLRAAGRRLAALGGGLAGLALGALWLTREEGFWILPALALLAAWSWAHPPQPPRWAARVAALSAGLGAFAAVWGAVASLNAAHYGVFATQLESLPAAYGALTRVEHRRWRPYVPVPTEARLRIYPTSPAFMELAPHLDGPVGRFWAASSCPGVGVCDDVGGGWFTWALRDAAQAAGHCVSGRAAEQFWAQVATEVDRACRDGVLPCGPERSSLAERWNPALLGPLLDAAGRAAALLAFPEGVDPDMGASPLGPRSGAPLELLEGQAFATAGRGGVRLGVLEILARALPWLQAAALLAALPAFLWQGARSAWRRRLPPVGWGLAAALLGGAAARVAVLAWVDATSFPGVNVLYLAPAYPLVVAFTVFALDGLAGDLVTRRDPAA